MERFVRVVVMLMVVVSCKGKGGGDDDDDGANVPAPTRPGSAAPSAPGAPSAPSASAKPAPPPDPAPRPEHLVATAITAGLDFACAITEEQKIACWGSDREGQLGDGDGVRGDCGMRKCPSIVRGIDDAVALSAEINFICARRASGRVSCWGKGGYGNLGARVIPDRCTTSMGVEVPCALAPVDVVGVEKAVSLDVGGWHGCAVEQAGTVACWGSNIPGVKHTEVCTSGRANEACSRTAVKIAGISDAVEVGVADLAICVRTKAGRILCWGEHNSGELGDGKSTKHKSDKPVEVVGIRDAIQLAAGGFGFCARHASGEVSCWGNNDYGDLGDGTVGGETGKNKVLGRGKPGRVLVAAGKPLTGVQKLWLESGLRCASREDGLYCWGSIPRKMLPEGLSDPCPDATDGSCKRTAIKVADTSVQQYVSSGQSCILLATGKINCRTTGTVPAPR